MPPRSQRQPGRWIRDATRGEPYKPRFLGTVAVTPSQHRDPEAPPESTSSSSFVVHNRSDFLLLPMAPKRTKRAPKKPDDGKKKKAVAGPAQINPPQPRVIQALYDPSRFASEDSIANVRQMLGREFIGGDQLEARPGVDPAQDEEVVMFHDFSVIGLAASQQSRDALLIPFSCRDALSIPFSCRRSSSSDAQHRHGRRAAVTRLSAIHAAPTVPKIGRAHV